MISDIQIFRRRNNNYELPSKEWSLKDELFVSGRINLGLYDEVVFDQNHAPTLRKLIKLIKLFSSSSEASIELESKNGKILILKPKYNEIEFYSGAVDSKNLILKKAGYFDFGISKMIISLYRQIELMNRESRNYYCNLLRPVSEDKFHFQLGDLVKTKKVQSIKNDRKGMIGFMEYHRKFDSNYYYILIDGEFHNRRYKKEEITLL